MKTLVMVLLAASLVACSAKERVEIVKIVGEIKNGEIKSGNGFQASYQDGETTVVFDNPFPLAPVVVATPFERKPTKASLQISGHDNGLFRVWDAPHFFFIAVSTELPK